VMISATATSKLPVTVTTSSPCSITNLVLTSSAASGTCSVRFTTDGDANYSASNETRTVTLAAATPKLPDPITVTSKFDTNPAQTWNATPLSLLNGNSLVASANSLSGLAVSTF